MKKGCFFMKKTNFKKLLSMVLALVFVLSTLAVLPLTASAEGDEELPPAPPTIDGLTGAGTESDPYIVASADDLLKLVTAAQTMTAKTCPYVSITQSFRLPELADPTNLEDPDRTKYCFNTTSYGGTNINWTIDGNNNTISNLVEPLFGGCSGTNVFKNLTLQGDIIHTTGRYNGAFVGGAYGESVTFENCHFRGSFRATYAREKMVTGGIVGLVDNCNLTMKNCTNEASIRNDAVTTNGEAYVGGLVGLVSQYSSGETILHYFENCSNSGTITVATSTSLYASHAGGIIGAVRPRVIYANANHTAIFKNCTNEGTITGIANTQIAGISGSVGLDGDAIGLGSSTSVTFYGCDGGSYPLYMQGKIVRPHIFDDENDCACNEPGCIYSTHEFDNSWDPDCNKDTCDYVRLFVGTTGDTNERDYTWYTPDGGTEAAPYEIADAADLAGLSAMSYGLHGEARVNFDGKFFKLTDNIDMMGYLIDPINLDGAKVYFDGNGKTISNLNQTGTELGGVFGYLGAGSTLCNLTLDNVDISGIDTSAVAVANLAAGATVYNVSTTETCSVTTTTANVAAGIVGAIMDKTATPTAENCATVKFCVNNAPVTGFAVVGGIVGYHQGHFDYEISHCINKAPLSVVSTIDTIFTVGGILGKTDAAMEEAEDTYVESSVNNCYNVGKLSTSDNTALCYVGGIVGYVGSSEGAITTVAHCYDMSVRAPTTTSATNLKNAGIGAGSTSALML